VDKTGPYRQSGNKSTIPINVSGDIVRLIVLTGGGDYDLTCAHSGNDNGRNTHYA
jgi:hypothetical protein